MCWKIRDFVFCRKQQTLTRKDQQVALEPLLVEVLDYFCQNPDTLISREQLVAEVWQTRAVSDNAVSRVITKLRKVLHDNPRAPQFIATFPKKGYRFIAPVTWVEHHRVSKQANRPANRRLAIRWAVMALGIVGLLGWWLWNDPARPAPEALTGVQVLTRSGGDETMPAMSPDGGYLAYAEMSQGRMHLFLKDLTGGDTLELGQETGWNGPAAWSEDGKRLVYLNTTATQSRYVLQELDGLRLGKAQVIHRAPAGSAGSMVFTRNPQAFILTQRAGDGEPYVLYLLQLPTKTLTRLPQPPLIMAGNSQFDLNPKRNELLITSPNAEHWLDFYSLDLDSRQLQHLFELQEFTCCGIWDHAGERIVVKGSHPAQTLLRFDRGGQRRGELLRVPFRISTPARVPNGRDYLFAGGRLNRDLYFMAIPALERTAIVDSSVDDRLTALSPDGRQLAYISERSGSDEIWLHDIATGSNRRLTQFKDGRHYFDLAWSPDGSALAGVTINQMHIIDAVVGHAERLDIGNPMIRGMSWKDGETLTFSLHQDNQWRVHEFHLTDQQLSPPQAPWAFIRHGLQQQDTLWFHQNGDIFYGATQQPLPLTLDEPLLGHRFTLLKKGRRLFYLTRHNNGFEMRVFNMDQQQHHTLFQLDYPLGFAVDDRGIYFSDLKTYSRDIYRSTQAQ